MDYAALVVTPGMRCSATGRVIAIGDRTTFEPFLPVADTGHRPGYEPPPRRPSSLAVVVHGVDAGRLAHRRQTADTVEGWATLTGTWQGDALQVLDQHHGTATGGPLEPRLRWTEPPCRAPDEGWPRGEEADLNWPEDTDDRRERPGVVTSQCPGGAGGRRG